MYEEGIQKLVPRYDKYFVNGDYVERWKKVCAKACIFSFCIIKEYLGMATSFFYFMDDLRIYMPQ